MHSRPVWCPFPRTRVIPSSAGMHTYIPRLIIVKSCPTDPPYNVYRICAPTAPGSANDASSKGTHLWEYSGRDCPSVSNLKDALKYTV